MANSLSRPTELLKSQLVLSERGIDDLTEIALIEPSANVANCSSHVGHADAVDCGEVIEKEHRSSVTSNSSQWLVSAS